MVQKLASFKPIEALWAQARSRFSSQNILRRQATNTLHPGERGRGNAGLCHHSRAPKKEITDEPNTVQTRYRRRKNDGGKQSQPTQANSAPSLGPSTSQGRYRDQGAAGRNAKPEARRRYNKRRHRWPNLRGLCQEHSKRRSPRTSQQDKWTAVSKPTS